MEGMQCRSNPSVVQPSALHAGAALPAPPAPPPSPPPRPLTQLNVDGGEGQEAGHEHLRKRLPVPGQRGDLARVLGGAARRVELGLEGGKGGGGSGWADWWVSRLVGGQEESVIKRGVQGLALTLYSCDTPHSLPNPSPTRAPALPTFVFLPMMPPTTVSGKVTSAQMTMMITMVPKGSAAVVPYTQATCGAGEGRAGGGQGSRRWAGWWYVDRAASNMQAGQQATCRQGN